MNIEADSRESRFKLYQTYLYLLERFHLALMGAVLSGDVKLQTNLKKEIRRISRELPDLLSGFLGARTLT